MEESSVVNKVSSWFRESVMIKLVSIGFLILILLIPQAWVSSIIDERQARAETVVDEIAGKWADGQTVTGPVMMVPFTKIEKTKRWEKGVEIEERTEIVHRAYFLPRQLVVNGDLKPEVLHRGIFEAVVYESKLEMQTSFDPLSFERWGIPDAQVHWNEAVLLLGISDLRGITENIGVTAGNKSFESEPSSDIGVGGYNSDAAEYAQPGITVDLNWKSRADYAGDFTIHLQFRGSDQLYVVPAGKTTDVKLTGAWSSPSFDGALLPTQREVSADGFSASWKVLSYNRPFAQQWQNREQSLNGHAFGVRLLIPADQYQKSIRTAKYGVLVIILAFTALFLVEISNKIRIHPFQYILIGAALIIYYTLLISVSEHTGYNIAYLLASVSTVIMVALYSTTFLPSKAVVATFAGLMTLFYSFIFVIIQAEDYSLLIGSVGLFIIIAAIMYFSRNIRWYREGTTN
jgi:inner membrane protein